MACRPTWKNSVRLLATNEPLGLEQYGLAGRAGMDLRRVEGGMLVQDWDPVEEDKAEAWEIATDRSPNDAERWAWECLYPRPYGDEVTKLEAAK